jgi:hypothetical protein
MENIIKSEFFNEANILKLKEEFNNAKPYRHLAIDNFLNAEFAEQLYA